MATALVVVGSEHAWAEPSWASGDYDFVDVIDTWTCGGEPDGPFDAVMITQSNPLLYEHDITGYGVPDQHQVAQAWLELDFTNDSYDGFGSAFCGLIRWDFRESAKVGFDGEQWQEVGEVDDGVYSLVLDVDWLNDDGVLDVTIEVSNPLGTATAWLDHSVLYGNMAHAPAPAAVLLGMLGLGYAGMRLRRKCD